MKTVYYADIEKKLDEKHSAEIARELKKKSGYSARERKSRLNPKELELQDELAKRRSVG